MLFFYRLLLFFPVITLDTYLHKYVDDKDKDINIIIILIDNIILIISIIVESRPKAHIRGDELCRH